MLMRAVSKAIKLGKKTSKSLQWMEKGRCFEASVCGYEPDYWDERELTGDEGQSWDECIHYPAYQDEYFTMPFHHLYCDCFDYSFEDLCNINDFRVNVNVRLVTKEQD